MTSSNNRGNTASTGHLSSSNETSSTVNELHIIEPLAKEVPREPSNNPGYFQNFGGSPQTDYNISSAAWVAKNLDKIGQGPSKKKQILLFC